MVKSRDYPLSPLAPLARSLSRRESARPAHLTITHNDDSEGARCAAVGKRLGERDKLIPPSSGRWWRRGSFWKMPGPSFPYPMLSECRFLQVKTQRPSRPWRSPLNRACGFPISAPPHICPVFGDPGCPPSAFLTQDICKGCSPAWNAVPSAPYLANSDSQFGFKCHHLGDFLIGLP